MGTGRTKWYHELTRYHWFVLMVAALGWLFDCLDQHLFNLARRPAMMELLATSPNDAKSPGDVPAPKVPPSAEAVGFYGPLATSIFLIGWGTGGLAFGVLGDRIGRAKTMLWTILMYSAFTGLSAFSVGFWDFAFYRFLTGLGVGGEFAVGVALVAEVMPNNARPYALGLLQALSAVGNASAALINIALGVADAQGAFEKWELFGQPLHPWRLMFLIGIFPALLAVLIRRRLKEPERWQAVAADSTKEQQAGSFRTLFSDPRWRRNALVGLALAAPGVIGLWSLGFFTPDLLTVVLNETFKAEGMPDSKVAGNLMIWTGIGFTVMNIGSFFGVYSFSYLTQWLGRRPAFALAFTGALISSAAVFWNLDTYAEIFWMLPIMGFFQLSLFGGYAIYFPELFPTYLRSTGTSFCYNGGRFIAAAGPLTLGYLTKYVFSGYAEPLPLRYAGVTLSAIFLLGLLVLPFAPETRGKPLPE
jgi:MFS family permease